MTEFHTTHIAFVVKPRPNAHRISSRDCPFIR